MARTEIPVDQNRLTAAIIAAEANGPLATQSHVWEAAAVEYNKGVSAPYKPIEAGVVRLRAVKWKLQIITTSAKGRGGGTLSPTHRAALAASRGKRVKRAEKFAGDSDIVAAHGKLREWIKVQSPVHLPLVDAIEKGSMKAAIKLQCIQCMGFENVAESIRTCTSKRCTLYAFRPYKPGQTDEDEVPESAEAETAEAETEAEVVAADAA